MFLKNLQELKYCLIFASEIKNKFKISRGTMARLELHV